jgi:alpha,alpha-trehalase
MAPSLRRAVFFSLSIAAAAAAAPAPVPVAPADALSPARVAAVSAYIKNGWNTLSRSTRDLAKAAPDPKFPRPAGQPWPVYLPPEEDSAAVEAELKKTMSADDLARIELRVLPPGRAMPSDPGLLYLPRPYVVPGGRFNEMYGWDSYFIQVGLLADGRRRTRAGHGREFLYRSSTTGRSSTRTGRIT